MLRHSTILALLASTALASGAFAQAPGAPTKVGVAAAVNQQLTGTPPAAAGRVVNIGNDVFPRERLVTDARGQAQMLFLDGSAFTVGPDSDLVLDEFVYDPASGTGKLAATAAKGVVRFVGGKLSKNQPVTITTPTATIGIRGGIGIVSIDASTGATSATFLFGAEMTVTSASGSTEKISRAGFTTTVESRAAAPTPATRATTEQIKQNLEQLNGRADATGGAAQQPTSGQVAQRMPGQAPTQPPPPPPSGAKPAGPAPGATQTTSTTANRDATQQGQKNALSTAALPAGAIVSYQVNSDPALASNAPTVRGQATGNANGSSSNFFGVSSGSTGTVKSVQVSIAVDGTGSTQKSFVAVTTGEVGDGAGMLASTRGTSRNTGDRDTTGIASSSTLSGTGAMTSFAAGRMPAGFVQTGGGTDAQLSGGSASYGYRQTGQRITSTPVVGARETTVLNGYASAFVESHRADGRLEPSTSLLAGQNGQPSGPVNVSINTDAANGRVAATFNLKSLNDPSAPAGSDGLTSVALNFGADPARGTYVDRSRFAAVESNTGAVVNDGGGTKTADSTRLYMASSGFANVSLPGGVQACQCEFVQWGWWGGVVDALSSDGVQKSNHLHMGNWVAGPIVSQTQMPTTGSASYSGHAVGTVINQTQRYIAAGNFSAQYNFGSRSGTMAISNFDGLNVTGNMASQNGRDYAANLSITGKPGLTGTAQGSFFSGGGDPVRETGGQFSISNAPGSTDKYAVNGVFVGKKQ
ncbi:MAG: hypothetical protein FJX60_06100 [Alphaproteobacteria bacterium]|nr:hypothetical protein [Alphaproteobacteria bacterium]